MRPLARMMLVLLAGIIAQAEDKLDNKLPVVPASVPFNIGNPPARTVFCAEGQASNMFAEAGVRVIWYARLLAASGKGQPILIDIAPNTPEMFHRGAMGYARLFEGLHITIFWDRLRGAGEPVMTTALLAHLLVHEMTHILQGTNHHSREGIMKDHWTAGDICDMARKPLSFDPVDVELIHSGLALRSNRSDRGLEKVSLIHDTLQTGPNDK